MKRFTRTGLAIALATAGALPVMGFAVNAGAAETAWTGGPVTIRVELVPFDQVGVKVQQVENVIPGPGIELTSDDVVANPNNSNGSVQVDIDPDAKTVTVATGQIDDSPKTKETRSIDELEPGKIWDSEYFSSVTVTISGTNFETFTNVSDDLFEINAGVVKSQRSIEEMPLLTNLSGGVANASWATGPGDDTPNLGFPGVAVFAYTIGAPSTTTVAPTTTVSPTTTVAVVANQAQVATPTAATPSYTG